MLRLVALCMAAGLLVVACGLMQPPPPEGTDMVQIKVSNASADPIGLGVFTDGRSMAGAAQPASVGPRTATLVAFYVPVTGDWSIMVGALPILGPNDLGSRRGVLPEIEIVIDIGGSVGFCRSGCR